MPASDDPLAKQYAPAEHEPRILRRWSSSGVFHADPGRVNPERASYAILIPPPNVTAALHLGHALNNTLQDVLCRVHRMKGFEVLWMPGTDHAGIATQTVVEKRLLAEEGKRRTDFDRDEFIGRVRAWKDEYEATITNQLRSIGCSCDWDRQRFTMDETCARAVREGFFRLFRDGLIERGKRLVNWDPVTRTALADDEVEMRDVDGHFWYLRYPLVREQTEGDAETAVPVTWSELIARGYPERLRPGGPNAGDDDHAFVTVATTRPETYLGDTAVAVHPDDPRAGAVDGLLARLPIVGRTVPLIKDDYVVMPGFVTGRDSGDAKAQLSTGFLKVTPAHDPNDYLIGQRHAETIGSRCSAGGVLVNVMDESATISDAHGWSDVGDAHLFVGLSREDARERVEREFSARGLLEGKKPHLHAVGHSYRSHAAIEPWLSDQWYCRVTDDRLRGAAQRALAREQRSDGSLASWPESSPGEGAGDGGVRFFPERYAKTYEAWHDGLRDWCISRQLWWGHRIPVWRGTGHFRDRLDSDEFSAFCRALFGWMHDGRISCQVRGERAEPTELEIAALTDESAFFVCVRDPDGRDAEIVAFLESKAFERDADVLDTWFSSALWPLSTMGWPEPGDDNGETAGLLEAFNPTDVLCTGRDIITLWVSRMVMFNRHFRGGDVPYRHVYINPIIQDGYGQRMSKSLGNGVDPLDIVHSHGADALRLVMTQLATSTQDVRLPVDTVCPHTGETFEPETLVTAQGHRVAAPTQACPSDPGKSMVTAYGVASGRAAPSADAPLARNTSSRFDAGRNFCTKLWNAARFTLMQLGRAEVAPAERATRDDLTLADRWMLSRLAQTVGQIDEAIASYQFSRYAELVYDVMWRDFCDWYLEAVKPTAARSAPQLTVLRAVLDAVLRLLHPICPFITEVVYDAVRSALGGVVEGLRLGAAGGKDGGLCVSSWPEAADDLVDADAERAWARVQALVEAVRRARNEANAPTKARPLLHVPSAVGELCDRAGGVVESLAQLGGVTTEEPDAADPASLELRFEGEALTLSGLGESMDAGALRAQLEQQASKIEKAIGVLEKRLGNPGYVEKAPAAMVRETREQLESSRAELEGLRSKLEELG